MVSLLRSIDLRGVLAALFSVTSVFLWVTTGDVPPALLAVTCLLDGVVIGAIGSLPEPARLEAVDAPYIPEPRV